MEAYSICLLLNNILCSIEFTEIENALSFTKYLNKETQIVVWNTVFTNVRGIFNKLSGAATFAAFKVRYN
jgi:hypothetical protein